MDNRRLLSRPSQLRDFGAKLRLTAMLFGCDNQKALDALFREADPNTDFASWCLTWGPEVEARPSRDFSSTPSRFRIT